MLRKAHGKAAQLGRVLVVEGAPADELPAGTPAEQLPPAAPGMHARLRAGKPTAEDQRRAAAGRARQQAAVKSLVRLGLPPGAGATLAPFLRDAERWAVAECKRLARDVGGGHCPPNVCSLVRSAALAMAGAAAMYAEGDVVRGGRCSAEQRANLLAAYELCAREAKARGPRVDPALAKLFAEDGG